MAKPQSPNTKQQTEKPQAKVPTPAMPDFDHDDDFDFGGISKEIDLKKNLGCGG